MATRWQQLGGFVNESSKMTGEQFDRFAAIGGKWIVFHLSHLGYPEDHDPSQVRNRLSIDFLKNECTKRGIACGAWFTGWNGGTLGTTPAEDAERVRRLSVGLGPIQLDLEAAYKGDPHALPALLWEVRQRIKTREIAVNTNEPNDSMPYNGHAHHGSYKGSMRRLNIKLTPQWYNAPAYGQGTWMQPDQTMEWIKNHGMEDNWYDPTYVGNRAIPLSYIHGLLEVTGLEGADLAGELQALARAKQFGYTAGFSVYLLEDMPKTDFDLVKNYRGTLYYV